jgi:endo-1,4-beta-D-glucanase Y
MLYRHFALTSVSLFAAIACVAGSATSPNDDDDDGDGTGGSVATGGVSGFGGTPPTGGAGPSGGVSGTGVGGAAPTGGAFPTGGTATGGTATGGAAPTGGTATGGTATGGALPTGGTATGGTATGGTATGGTGGGTPMNPYGGKGFMPSSVRASDAMTQWTNFKAQHVVACGSQYRVSFSTASQTVSEGIAYGMLGAVGNGDRTVFDGLWAYYKQRRNANGFMHWKIDGCTTNPTSDGMGSATDAELDAAMALIQAECKWPGSTYRADAQALLTAIRMHEVSGNYVLPGDSWGGGGAGCINPSYFSPGYYRAFALVDTAQASFWNSLASAGYSQLGADGSTGLVPDWRGSCASRGGNYGWDAVRTPWRIATDYLWWGTAEAGAFLQKMSSWASAGGGGAYAVSEVQTGYQLNGTKLDMGARNSAFSGGFMFAGMGASQMAAEDYTGAFLSVNQSLGDNAYFQRALRTVFILLPAGLFPKGC